MIGYILKTLWGFKERNSAAIVLVCKSSTDRNVKSDSQFDRVFNRTNPVEENAKKTTFHGFEEETLKLI